MMRERNQGEGGSEGDVVRDPDAVVDHVPDEGGLPDELDHDVVAEREREREDRAGDDAGHDQREDHLAERPPASSPKVGGGLEEGTGNPFERRVHRQDT